MEPVQTHPNQNGGRRNDALHVFTGHQEEGWNLLGSTITACPTLLEWLASSTLGVSV